MSYIVGVDESNPRMPVRFMRMSDGTLCRLKHHLARDGNETVESAVKEGNVIKDVESRIVIGFWLSVRTRTLRCSKRRGKRLRHLGKTTPPNRVLVTGVQPGIARTTNPVAQQALPMPAPGRSWRGRPGHVCCRPEADIRQEQPARLA